MAISTPIMPCSMPSVQAHLAALRWLLLSPPLVALPQGASAQLAQFSPGERSGITQWLNALQAQPGALVDWMHTRAEVRIGRYAEQLLAFYLTHGPQHRLLAAHVPLRSIVQGGKNPVTLTHGELDFLLTDATGQHLHWELAVKFFLCTATGSVANPTDFIGPNGIETLAHKWHKLFARQLAHTPPAPFDTQRWQPQAFTRGWMFYRWGAEVPRCAALHADHAQAWWVNVGQIFELPEGDYVHLPRLQWMAPVTYAAQLNSDNVVLQRDAMARYLQVLFASNPGKGSAQMVARLAATQAQCSLGASTKYELQRWMVCPENFAQLFSA